MPYFFGVGGVGIDGYSPEIPHAKSVALVSFMSPPAPDKGDMW